MSEDANTDVEKAIHQLSQVAHPQRHVDFDTDRIATMKNPRKAANVLHLPVTPGEPLEVGAVAAGVNKDLLNTTIEFIGPRDNIPFLEIEFLYRHNVLYSRAQLFKHCAQISKGIPFLDRDMITSIREDLGHYTKAVQDYHAFRAEGGGLFEDSQDLVALGTEIAKLEDLEPLEKPKAEAANDEKMKGVTAELDRENEESKSRVEELEKMRLRIQELYDTELKKATTSGLLKRSKVKAAKALTARIIMAVGGGLALIAPMLIMTLHPTKLTRLLTSSCFIIAVAVALAAFMDTAEPKDIIASTAAYAAVLVIFVGAAGNGP